MCRLLVVACFLGTLLTNGAQAKDLSLLEKLECGIVERASASQYTPPLNENITLLMVGSSSTSGVGAGGLEWAYPKRTAVHLNKSSTRFDVTVESRGVGGERATGAQARLAQAIEETSPDVLIWQVGTNDALAKIPLDAFERTLRQGLKVAHSYNLPVVLVDPQFFPRISGNQHYSDVISFMRAFAEAENLPLVERYKRMKRAIQFDETAMASLLAKDRFHMSALGHECLALDLSATLKALLQNSSQAGDLGG